MKLVVFGATGGVGRAAAAAALARGDEVTALVRRPARLHLRQVRVVEGDALDAAAVAGAIRGQDAVLSALGGRPWRDTDVCARGSRTIVDAMGEHGVRRLVVVSSLGVGESRQRLGWLARRVAVPLVLRRGLEDRQRMEENRARQRPGLDDRAAGASDQRTGARQLARGHGRINPRRVHPARRRGRVLRRAAEQRASTCTRRPPWPEQEHEC